MRDPDLTIAHRPGSGTGRPPPIPSRHWARVPTLAVDNERLRAARLCQAADIQQSRERIIEAGDAARRDTERDLHDGAQQRLVALSLRLRLARVAADGPGRAVTASLVGEALDQSLAVIIEVRDLAHGIYPVELANSRSHPPSSKARPKRVKR